MTPQSYGRDNSTSDVAFWCPIESDEFVMQIAVSLLFHPCPSAPSRGTRVVHHADPSALAPPLAPTEIYVGMGIEGSEYFTPSPWLDPSAILFPFLSFEEYLDGRADAINWLAPLYGRTVVGTCGRSECHTRALAEQVNDLVYWRIRCTNPNFSAQYFGGR